MQQPKLLSKVWAALGLKNDIPDSRKTGIPNESATYEEGFPQITMTPIALGGKAPSGKDMNGILNELSAHTVYQNQGGVYKFDSAFAEKIGGYSKGSLLINNKLDKLFISLVDKNKTDFNSQDFSGKWEVVSGVNFFVPKTQKATLQETGIVKLYSGYDSDAEDLAATPKAIKTLKAFIDAITRNLGNYIPNSKKSSRVDSNSADDVATSAAAKTAYDKGVEAKNAADNAQRSANDGINRANNAQNSANDGINRANNAQLAAEAANRNANTRVAKSGDTMDGDLTVPNINTGAVISSGYLNISSKNGIAFYKNDQRDYLALLSDTGFYTRKVVLSPNGYRADNLGYGGYGSQYDYSAPFEVIESGGNSISTYYPFIKGKVMSRGNSGAAFSLGYTTKQANYYEYGNFGRGVINLVEDNGRYKNWEFEHTGVFRSAGDVITGNGNSLDWYSHALNSLIDGITSSSYGSHYQGADVFKIKQNRLMIIRMQIGVANSSGDYYLPESFDGSAGVIAIDSGGAVNPVGAFFKGGNTVYISVTKPTNVTVIAIGVKN